MSLVHPCQLDTANNLSPFSSKNIQECRCGTASCRGVLGPRPKERDLKEALKPLVTAGKKRKISQVVGNAVKSIVSKKRKIAVPKSVKSAVQTVKRKVSMQLTKAKVVSSTAAQNARLVKKVSERSLRGTQRTQQKKRTTVTFTHRRAPTNAARSVTKRQQPASVRKNVVRTIKGSNRAGATRTGSKSIRVISALVTYFTRPRLVSVEYMAGRIVHLP